MKQLVFLYNDLLDEDIQKKARLPLEFICFAYINNAIMYDLNGKYVAIHENELKKTYKYNKVYGALYVLDNSEYNLRNLDAIMVCSKGLIGSNHKYDLMHRQKIVLSMLLKSI